MKYSKAILLLSLCLLSLSSRSQEPDTVVTLLFTGDIMCHTRQLTAAFNDSTSGYDFDTVFKYISPLIREADIAVGNLEVTLGGKPYTGYPAFSAPDALATACRDNGFDLLVTANNHSADRGSSGVRRTIAVLDSLGIKHTGTWKSKEARDTLSPELMESNGIRIAFLNSTYGTNGLTVSPPPLIDYIDTVRIAGDVAKSRDAGAGYVILFVHWGNEYDTLPSTFQKNTAAALFRAGVDMIVGSHPHVIQPMTALADSTGLTQPVVWSLGNFISNQRSRRSDGGAMVRIELRKINGKVYLAAGDYILTWVYAPEVNGKREFYILPCSEYEDNSVLISKEADREAMKLFLTDARRLLNNSNVSFHELIMEDEIWIEALK